jgi:hypothetical protein
MDAQRKRKDGWSLLLEDSCSTTILPRIGILGIGSPRIGFPSIYLFSNPYENEYLQVVRIRTSTGILYL